MKVQKLMIVGLLVLVAGLAMALFNQSGAKSEFGLMTRLGDKYGTDKGTKAHSYTVLYDHFFTHNRHDIERVLEIGLGTTGGSMKMYRDFFPNAEIHGFDIEDCADFEGERMFTYIADQSKRDQLEKALIDSKGNFDIIIDDGGHTMDQQQISFGYLFPHVKRGGYYIIEDLHTSFFGDDYNVEKGGKNSTVTMINKFIAHGKIDSKYMTQREKDYLEANLEYCSLISRHKGGSIMCVFKKKN